MRPQQPMSAMLHASPTSQSWSFRRSSTNGQRRLGFGPELGDDLRMGGAKPGRMAHLGDRGDVVGLPRQPLARLPALLLGCGLEMAGRAREIVEDYIRLQDRQPAMAQRRDHSPAVDCEVFRGLLHPGLQVDRAERIGQPRQGEIEDRLVARTRGKAAVDRQPVVHKAPSEVRRSRLRERCRQRTRVAALATALSEAVTMLASMPTPHSGAALPPRIST